MDEKPARMLHSPARSIGLFKRYQVLSIVGNLLDVDVSRDDLATIFSRIPAGLSGSQASDGEIDGVKGW